MRLLIASAAAFAFALGVAGAEEVRELPAKASEILSKYEGGEGARSCLPVSQIDSMKVLDDRILLVETKAGKFYLNETPGRCSGAARGNRRLEYSTSEPAICRGQVITVVDNHTRAPVGSCSLGDFHALTEKPVEQPAEDEPSEG